MRRVSQPIRYLTSGQACSAKGITKEKLNSQRSIIERIFLLSSLCISNRDSREARTICLEIEAHCIVLLTLLKSDWLVIKTSAARVLRIRNSECGYRAHGYGLKITIEGVSGRMNLRTCGSCSMN